MAPEKALKGIVCGFHPVEEALLRGRRSIGALYLSRQRKSSRTLRLEKLAREKGIKVKHVDMASLESRGELMTDEGPHLYTARYIPASVNKTGEAWHLLALQKKASLAMIMKDFERMLLLATVLSMLLALGLGKWVSLSSTQPVKASRPASAQPRPASPRLRKARQGSR